MNAFTYIHQLSIKFSLYFNKIKISFWHISTQVSGKILYQYHLRYITERWNCSFGSVSRLRNKFLNSTVKGSTLILRRPFRLTFNTILIKYFYIFSILHIVADIGFLYNIVCACFRILTSPVYSVKDCFASRVHMQRQHYGFFWRNINNYSTLSYALTGLMLLSRFSWGNFSVLRKPKSFKSLFRYLSWVEE